MNKKLMVLIVALECVFAVFLISIFGPIIESLTANVAVSDIYFVDEAGERIENESSILIDLEEKRSHHLSFAVVTEEATDRTVQVLHDREADEIEILMDPDGFGFAVRYLKKDVTSVRITIRTNDATQKEAVITLIKRDSDVNIGDDFLN